MGYRQLWGKVALAFRLEGDEEAVVPVGLQVGSAPRVGLKILCVFFN